MGRKKRKKDDDGDAVNSGSSLISRPPAPDSNLDKSESLVSVKDGSYFSDSSKSNSSILKE